MNNAISQHEDLISYIKNVILKYCPYTEDRLLLLGNGNSPELDIDIKIETNNNESLIMFILGNRNVKASVPERATISHTISFEEIAEIVDWILKDHEIIHNLNLYDKRFDLEFAINWSNRSIKGINCGNIGLSLTFDNPELTKKYLSFLFQKYYINLEGVPSFKKIRNEYLNSMKHSYFETLNKNELLSLLNRMNEEELKELLYILDNDTFIKYIMSNNPPKVLSLEKHNKK